MSGKRQLSRSNKWVITGLSTTATIGLVLAGIVASRYPVAAIWVIALSLLMYVLVFWISSQGRLDRRTPYAIALCAIVVAGCGFWGYTENRNSNSAKEQSAPPGTTNIQQNASGAGSAAVAGNGNNVNTNAGSAPEEHTQGEKK